MKKLALFQLHIAVLLWGFTGVFGKAISLQEIPLVWWRMLITFILFGSIVLGMYLWQKEKLVLKNPRLVVLTSFFIMLHWLCFYGSIKQSNISIALCCLSLSSIFSSILSPIFFKTKFQPLELLAGTVSLIGILILLNFQIDFYIGILLGIAAALLSALFTLCNERLSREQNPIGLAFVEMGVGWVLLSLVLPLYLWLVPSQPFLPHGRDLSLLFWFSALCTVAPMILSLYALREVSAFTLNLTVNLEPVYGILAAFYFFNEYQVLNWGFYLGMCFIVLSLFLHIVFKTFLE